MSITSGQLMFGEDAFAVSSGAAMDPICGECGNIIYGIPCAGVNGMVLHYCCAMDVQTAQLAIEERRASAAHARHLLRHRRQEHHIRWRQARCRRRRVPKVCVWESVVLLNVEQHL